jgi:hypothetical protein
MPRAALLVLALLAAGCAGPSGEDSSAPNGAGVVIDERRPETSFAAVSTGPASGPDLAATTAHPPLLVPGEWWRIRFHSALFDETPDFLRVVAAVEEDGYLIGMPHEGWAKETIAYHSPAFGDIGLDLSYALHNARFEPLRFPLTTGATWTTTFGTTEYVATVEHADEHTAAVRLDPPPSDPQPTDVLLAALSPIEADGTIRLVYDARQHEVVSFTSMIGSWEVIEHGYGFTGWVTVPRGIHTAIDHGQFLPATPGEPILTRTLTIEGGFNRLTILQGIFALGPGAYRVSAIAPDGTEFTTESRGDRGLTMSFHEAADPDGPWTLEDVVGGPGGTYTMGMAYHQYDIRLPDGAKRSDHSHPVVR